MRLGINLSASVLIDYVILELYQVRLGLVIDYIILGFIYKRTLFSLEENSLPAQRQREAQRHRGLLESLLSEFSMKCAYDKVHITEHMVICYIKI